MSKKPIIATTYFTHPDIQGTIEFYENLIEDSSFDDIILLKKIKKLYIRYDRNSYSKSLSPFDPISIDRKNQLKKIFGNKFIYNNNLL